MMHRHRRPTHGRVPIAGEEVKQMANILDLQGMGGSSRSSPGQHNARSSISIYRCGKKDNSTVSLAWCGTNIVIRW